jgi:hypothetical protein
MTGNGIAAPNGSGPGSASMADTAQFQEAMHQPGMQPSSEVTSGQVPGTEGSRSMLEGIDKMSADMRAMQGDLQNATSSMG